MLWILFPIVCLLHQPTPTAADMGIRLTGNKSCSGRVEIKTKKSNTWAKISSDAWDLDDVKVACRQLDCGTPLMATNTQVYGQGTKDWFHGFNCLGDESSLTNCKNHKIVRNTSGHYEAAGVICSGIFQRINISLTSPKGGVAWTPEGAEVTRGHGFVFTCSVISSYPEGRFSLILSGSEVTYTKPAVNLAASFNFPFAETKHQGKYSCLYELTLLGQTFNSTETVPITVIIKSPLLLLVSSACAGSLLLLGLVLLVAYLVFRRRSVVITSSRRLSGDRAEQDKERDYVNVNPGYLKKKQWGRVGGAEAAESDPDDDDGDYVNVETDGNQLKAAHVNRWLKDNGEEEETSEEGGNYVNRSQIFNDHNYVYVDADVINTEAAEVGCGSENSEEDEETSEEAEDYENVIQISNNHDHVRVEMDVINMKAAEVSCCATENSEEDEDEGGDYENISQISNREEDEETSDEEGDYENVIQKPPLNIPSGLCG